MKIKLVLVVVAGLLLLYFTSIKIQLQNSVQTNTITSSNESTVQIELKKYQSSTTQHSFIILSPTTQSHSITSDNTTTGTLTNVLDSTLCNDQLCTQYLNKLDMEMFKNCTRHLQKKAQDLVNNGTCRFIDGMSHRRVALASFPGSGNTWVRGLLEKATGICTGSVYCDSSLRIRGFNGEGVSSSSVIAVKTHESVKSFEAAIHIVRCPNDAIVSEWNRKHGKNHNNNKHTAQASPQDFGNNKEWDSFVHEWAKRWAHDVWRIAKYQKEHPVLRIFYEDLKTNTSHELMKMLRFLKVPHQSMTNLQQQLLDSSSLEIFHRQRKDGVQTTDHFTQEQMKAMITMLSQVIVECTARGFKDSKDYVSKYLKTCIKEK